MAHTFLGAVQVAEIIFTGPAVCLPVVRKSLTNGLNLTDNIIVSTKILFYRDISDITCHVSF